MLSQPCVYKAFDKQGNALYVGASKYGISRFLHKLHLRKQVISSADKIEVEFFKTEKEAFEVEAKTIRILQPINNNDVSFEQAKLGKARTCTFCEKQFLVKREWQRFCSDECRNEHWLEGHKKLSSYGRS